MVVADVLRSECEAAVVSAVDGPAPFWRELALMLDDATVAAMRRGRLLTLLLLYNVQKRKPLSEESIFILGYLGQYN